jgi:hypothetical protein
MGEASLADAVLTKPTFHLLTAQHCPLPGEAR